MTKDLVPAEQHTVAQTEGVRVDVVSQLMRVIESNPTQAHENVKALLDGVERMAKWQAEQEFNAAFARLKFPPFKKTAKGHNAKYAPLEDIQEVIEPILAKEGFTLTFSSGEANTKGEVPTFGLLSHIGGHSRQGCIYLPPDVTPTRSGSTTMNALQSVGSSTSYGMRYVAKLMLNLRFVGEDTDGNQAGYITENQARQLDELILKSDANLVKFLEIYGAKTIREIHAFNFKPALAQLEAKYRAKLDREKGMS